MQTTTTFRSTERLAVMGGALAFALATAMGCAATQPMPTPPSSVRTTNVVAPSFEYRPPAPSDAGPSPLPSADAGAPSPGASRTDSDTAPDAATDAGAGRVSPDAS